MAGSRTSYIGHEEALVIHARMVDKTGGSDGLRDRALFESALGRPRQLYDGKELYRTTFGKAAALFESLAMNHPFVDGNKRTAVTLAIRFLYKNNFHFTAEKREVEEFTLSVVIEKRSVSEIAVWLKAHGKKQK